MIAGENSSSNKDYAFARIYWVGHFLMYCQLNGILVEKRLFMY